MRAPEKHVFLSWSCNSLSKFTTALTLWFKTTFILKRILNVRQNPYLWEKSWVFALPQMQACIHLWRWLGKFERTIKASETIKISPSSLPVLGISLSDEQTTSVCNALWSPDLNPPLTCRWLKPVNGHTHPCLSISSGQQKLHREGESWKVSQSCDVHQNVDLQAAVSGVVGCARLVMDVCPRTKGRHPGRFNYSKCPVLMEYLSEWGKPRKTAETN